MKKVLKVLKQIILLPFDDIRATLAIRNWILDITPKSYIKSYNLYRISFVDHGRANEIEKYLVNELQFERKIIPKIVKDYPSINEKDVKIIWTVKNWFIITGIFNIVDIN